ncbi:hypothetical protein ACFE04_021228 [Oxalis oulophora]
MERTEDVLTPPPTTLAFMKHDRASLTVPIGKKRFLRENCFKRLREDSSRLLWKLRTPNKNFISSSFRGIVSDELEKINNASSSSNNKLRIPPSAPQVDHDMLWELDALLEDSERQELTWEDEEDEYLARAVYEHMQLNREQKKVWCPICNQGELRENKNIINCTLCKLHLNKADEVNLEILKDRLAELHAEHFDRGCRLTPKFCVEDKFGLTALSNRNNFPPCVVGLIISALMERCVEERVNSCIKVALDFVSPENVGECIRLSDEFRLLPPNYRAKEDKLEVKKMILYAINGALKDLGDGLGNNTDVISETFSLRCTEIKTKNSLNQHQDTTKSVPATPSDTPQQKCSPRTNKRGIGYPSLPPQNDEIQDYLDDAPPVNPVSGRGPGKSTRAAVESPSRAHNSTPKHTQVFFDDDGEPDLIDIPLKCILGSVPTPDPSPEVTPEQTFSSEPAAAPSADKPQLASPLADDHTATYDVVPENPHVPSPPKDKEKTSDDSEDDEEPGISKQPNSDLSFELSLLLYALLLSGAFRVRPLMTPRCTPDVFYS